MYGAFSGMSFGLVVLAALLVIALALFASPLLAIVLAAVAAIFLLIGMTSMRQRSERQDRTAGGASDTRSSGHGDRAGGAPASGEG